MAHPQLNGLLRLLTPGNVGVTQNATVRDTALGLLAAPLCASTLVEYMVAHLGWDADAVNASVPAMLTTWGEIAGAPYPGPEPSSESGH